MLLYRHPLQPHFTDHPLVWRERLPQHACMRTRIREQVQTKSSETFESKNNGCDADE